MTISRIGQVTDFGSQGTEFSVQMQTTDSGEVYGTGYIPNFKKWHGYYRQIPELRSVVNKLASWTFGRGIKASEENKNKLEKIKGWGKDSARGVLKNQWRVALICGDSFAHILPGGNLKPLNPDNVAIVTNKQGIIIGYELKGRKELYNPEEIYHLSYERIADEIHGIPFPEALEELILSRNEGIKDLRVLYHRNVKPIKFFEVETDDQAKLASVENTINEAYAKTENVVIPAGVIKEIKDSSTAQYSIIDPLPYIKFLVRQFVTACGMPEVVMGWGEETTEASSNIIYLAYQQEIEDMQQYNEEMILEQLGIELELEFPASLEKEIQMNEAKRGEGTSMQPGKDG
jgi:hypothetical protein